MSNKTLDMLEEALINMLKALPEDALVEIFWKTLVASVVSPLTKEEKEELREGTIEYKKGETITWEDLCINELIEQCKFVATGLKIK
ncbi:MAG: hypothetical protein HW390_1841 [Candidatus Brocadiaceae bacterium]|nr:hypothetical protein [Candidatus Brocadiaceae bacterium]